LGTGWLEELGFFLWELDVDSRNVVLACPVEDDCFPGDSLVYLAQEPFILLQVDVSGPTVNDSEHDVLELSVAELRLAFAVHKPFLFDLLLHVSLSVIRREHNVDIGKEDGVGFKSQPSSFLLLEQVPVLGHPYVKPSRLLHLLFFILKDL
jgi:hypothetical protein